MRTDSCKRFFGPIAKGPEIESQFTWSLITWACFTADNGSNPKRHTAMLPMLVFTTEIVRGSMVLLFCKLSHVLMHPDLIVGASGNITV